MARLFARHGVKATIISTPINTPFISEKIKKDRQLGADIGVRVIKFPSVEAGLPEGCENLNSITSPEMAINFKIAHILLQQPFEQLLQECHPDCIIADMVFPWATEVASKLGIPRLIFYGTSFFALTAFDCIRSYEPHKKVTSDLEPFTILGLPDHVKLTRLQLPNFIREADKNEIAKLLDQSHKAELTSYGVIINSFHELEPAYTEHYRKVMGRKAWHIGPISLSNRYIEDNDQGANNTAYMDGQECLRWLDSEKPKSVLYVCFGSVFRFSAAQLLEIARSLEASGQHFMWVQINNEDKEEWMPEGFEERMQGKVLRMGVGVGAQEWYRWIDEKIYIVKKDDIANAVTQLMVSEEAEKIRSKSKVLGQMARRTVEDGGSSYSDLNSPLENLRLHCP
ncbi:hypothetical protein Q3G72_010898 [Acer saccharum]|nr:hypothetical protein Q3G72_010898 [Acer saccharum]